jgi:hypothetical protein
LGLALAIAGCDPSLNLSRGPTSNKPVEGCAEAVRYLKSCCPAYDSYLSCTMSSTARNASATPDLSPGQSRCLLGKSCEQLERAVTGDRSLCDVSFRSRSCR